MATRSRRLVENFWRTDVCTTGEIRKVTNVLFDESLLIVYEKT